METINAEELNKFYDRIEIMLINYSPKVIGAILTLLIGLWVINRLVRLSKKLMEKNGMDTSLRTFLTSLVSIALKTLLLISVADKVGIETTSFIAVLGAAGLAVGLALQGSLSNFAGGVLVLLFKPYRVGDIIEAQGHLGEVSEIHIFVTKITTPDNLQVIIPNGSISNGNITNYTALGRRRVDLIVGISYGDDIKKAKEVLLEALKKNALVLDDPEPFVGVAALADSSVNFAVRPWCKVEDYWDVYFSCQEDCKYALDEAGISIPFPQRDVHLIGEEKA